MKLRSSVACTLLVLFAVAPGARFATGRAAAQTAAAPAAQAVKFTPEALDELLAPVALYPDQLLAQMLESSKIPRRVQEFSGWLVRNDELTGTALQDAAKQQGFEPSLVLLALFPKVINFMADNIAWTTQLGQAFTGSRESVVDAVQRLRAKALKAGTLKTTPQQSVKLQMTKDGKEVIVIEPANPQVVYVPQYNAQTVYVQPAPSTTTVVVQQQSSSTEAAVVGAAIGFTAGIAIGAAMNNNYYYGPYGWHGSPYMYNGAYNDWYDDRQDAREDWYDNREDAREDFADNRQDLAETRSDRAGNAQEQRTERAENRQNTRTETQGSRQGTAQAQSASGQTRSTAAASTASADSRGTTRANSTTAPDRSGTKSDAFSGYSSGRSERAASDRGKSSRSRTSSSGGGGRSRRK